MTRIEQLLRKSMGLDSASIGSSVIQRTVRLRMKTLGLKQEADYEQLLEGSNEEWNELIEAVIVTETWFFRDREPFSALVRLVKDEWLPAQHSRPLRLLSAPCSTGEEPYSLVMALLSGTVPRDLFQVDAVDISARVLARAKRGIYGKNSFRGKDLGFRDRYFKATREGFVLNETVRNCVSFRQDNILNDSFLAGKPQYDFIFCRNLLIYFDRATQRNALEKIRRLLTPSGVLFVGAAEQPWVLEHGFVPANIPMAFACRRASANGFVAARPRQRIQKLPQQSLIPPLVPNGNHQDLFTETPRALTGAKPENSAQLDLEAARRLADAGRLEEASAVCLTHLRERGASAQAYYLLGLVRDAAGDPAALDYYRKALYLEPNHYETLLQMALLSQKNGHLAQARTYKSRAQRIKNKT
jgi:chemotaxis protein methyltransferase WspC